ncbi:MAG: hypothetical protein HC819_01775 [Cyclobacteriaceae bacterium]|nr:hypothetical protein [Cyclobacteriaceae bacterium]
METVYSKDFSRIQILADEIHDHIIKKNTGEIIASINKMNTHTEFELVCATFYNKYKFSLYNKIWSFINLNDYNKIKKVLRRAE